MKRLCVVLFVVFLAASLILAGCGTQSPTTTSPPSKTVAPSSAAPSQPATAPSSSSAAPPSSAGVKPIEMKFSYWAAAQAPQPKTVFVPWAQAVENATNGRIKITHYPSETLVKQQDNYDAVTTGLTDIAFISTDSTPGRFPLSEFGSLPDVFPNAPIAARVYEEILEKYCASTELKNIKILYVSSYQPFQLFSTKQVQKLEDMKGFRLRTEGKMQDWTMQALGPPAPKSL